MDRNALVEYILRFINTSELPGLSASVVQDGEVVLAEGFGFRTAAGQSPVTASTLFHMASVSKPFSATAIMQLVEKGKIDLEAPVVTYLPYFEMDDDRFGLITIQQMLSHVSGMPDVRDYEWGSTYAEDDALERYVRSIADRKLLFDPGSAFAYSNIAFEILGHVIAKVSGLTFEEYIKRNIFQPLGMLNSTFLRSDVSEGLSVTPHIRLFDNQAAPIYPYNRAHAPSSTLHSNAEDMSRWMLANLDHGSLEGERILDARSYERLWTPYFRCDESRQVCLSWFAGQQRGLMTISHGGADAGFRSHLVMIPDRRLGVTVMTNIIPAPMDDLALGLLDILQGIEPAAPKKPLLYPVAGAYIKAGLEAARGVMQSCLAEGDLYGAAALDFMMLGDSLNDAGQPQQALDILHLGLELEPGSAGLHAAIAWVYHGLQNTADAREHLEQALRLDPDDGTVKVVKVLMQRG